MTRMSSGTSRILVAVCCCVSLLSLLSVEAPAQSPDWVLEAIKDATLDPGALHYFHGVHRDCPVVKSDAERIIEQVLIGNQIMPRHIARSRELSEHLFLDLWVSCVERGNHFIYVIDAYLALHSPLDGQRLFIAQRFGRFGAGDRDSILQSIRDSAASAVGAYLKATRGP